jgi:hypothetical protein
MQTDSEPDPADSGVAAAEPIGALLQRKGLISTAELADALATQRRWGCRIGEALIARGYVTAYQFAQVLAEHLRVVHVDLERTPPDPALFDPADRDTYVRLRAVPWRMVDGRIVIATSDPCDDIALWATARFGRSAVQVVTAPFDVHWEIQRRIPLDRTAQAERHLGPRRLRLLFAVLAAGVGAGLWLAPAVGLPVSTALAFLAVLVGEGGRLGLLLYGRRRLYELPAVDFGPLSTLRDDELPVYSLLVPLSGRPERLATLVDTLRRLDYPLARLDVKLIVDGANAELVDAAKRLRLESYFEIVRVPEPGGGDVATGLRYALQFVRGAFVAVVPDDVALAPDHLRRVVVAFARSGRRAGALSPVLEVDPSGGVIARLAGIDRAMQVDGLRPAAHALGWPQLARLDAHFRPAVLRETASWQPGAVAPGLDLGLRLLAAGLPVTPVDAVMLEAAPDGLSEAIGRRTTGLRGRLEALARPPSRLGPGLVLAAAALSVQAASAIGAAAFIARERRRPDWRRVVWAMPLLVAMDGLAAWFALLAFAFGRQPRSDRPRGAKRRPGRRARVTLKQAAGRPAVAGQSG